MADRTCPKCKVVFKFPSMLKIHVKNSFHCLTSSEDIEKYITEHTIPKPVININTEIKCLNCNLTFTQISSLTRHNKESKCAKTIKENEKKKTSEEYINQIKSLNPTLAKKIENLFKKEKEKETNRQLINNTTNNINNNTNNITNHTNNTNNIETQNTFNSIINQTNYNTITIQHINPFGLEDVRTIPISEMILILNSGVNAGLHIIKVIYNKLENKNFYKPNLSRPEIACLNEDFKLTIYKTKEFADALFDRCLSLLHHMLYICKTEITLNNIRTIYENIENIENNMRIEIYDKKLQNIIETEVRNNNLDTKNKISKYIKDIKEIPNIHNHAKIKLKQTQKLEKYSNDEYKITIEDKEINDIVGDPKLALGLTHEELQLDLRINRFEDSKFYKYWKNRIILESNIINNTNYNDGSKNLGDIIYIEKRKNDIEKMLEIIKFRIDNSHNEDYINLDVGERYSMISI